VSGTIHGNLEIRLLSFPAKKDGPRRTTASTDHHSWSAHFIYDGFLVAFVFATISLVGRCMAKNWFVDLSANSLNFAKASSRPTIAARQTRPPLDRF